MQQTTEAIGVAVDDGHDADPDAAAAAPRTLEFGSHPLQADSTIEEPGLRISGHVEPRPLDGAGEATTTQHAIDERDERDEGHYGEADGKYGSVHGMAILRTHPRYTPCMDVPEVDCSEAEAMREAGATWIDVREPHEWADAHIPDTELLPLQDAAEQVMSRFTSLDSSIVISCLTGARSGWLVGQMRAAGYSDVHNLRGGIQAWVGEGRPVIVGR